MSLDTSNSTDPDGDPLTCSWIQTAREPTVEMRNSNTVIVSFKAPANLPPYDTDLTFQLTVTDSKNATDTANTTVTVKHAIRDKPSPSIKQTDGTEYSFVTK